MSTHATISALANGKVKTIGLHFGSNILADLQEHYDTPEKVAALIKLGDLSSFDKSTECPEGHDYANRIDGHCVAYRRDRGEPAARTKARIYTSGHDAMKYERDQHNFYHDGEKWARI